MYNFLALSVGLGIFAIFMLLKFCIKSFKKENMKGSCSVGYCSNFLKHKHLLASYLKKNNVFILLYDKFLGVYWYAAKYLMHEIIIHV